MKKIFFTCVFAALSTVWTLSEAACLPPLPQVINTSIEGISGTLQWLPYPCIEGEVCPTCLSAAIVSVSGDSTYYLSSHNQEVQDFLEYLDQIPVPAIYQLPLRASACGALYHRDDYACLDINNLAGLYVEYFSDHYQHKGIPSLCDEWHMVVPSFDQISPGRTYMHRILKDTLINGQQYKMLESNESGSFTYDGAMREDAARIYFVPEGSAHEYLLYDFNAQVGQTLTNLWIGGLESEYNQISSVTVDRIEGIAPSRNFVLTYLYQGEYLLYFNWIEGVGMASGPAGWGAFPGEPVDPTPELLCAYKNGEQVYVSNYGEQYGCDYSSYFPMGMQWETVSPYSDNSCIVHGDTTINGMSYRIIVGKDKFIIPIRQEAKKIYAHLNDSDYLFYDFGLNVGDTISTFFEYDEEKGIHVSERPARVEAIETTTLLDGRVAKLFVYDRNRDPDIEYVGNLDFGVLMPFYTQQAFIPENLPGFCCSRYGRPVYGRCSRENENNVDTIPLFLKDGPGSSTVEPVDPNEIVATLFGNLVMINEYIDKEITYALYKMHPANMRAQDTPTPTKTNTFRDSVTLSLDEAGVYTLELTNPTWDYIITGTINYAPQGMDSIPDEPQAPRKLLINGQLYILKGDNIYTPAGIRVR